MKESEFEMHFDEIKKVSKQLIDLYGNNPTYELKKKQELLEMKNSEEEMKKRKTFKYWAADKDDLPIQELIK